jgi:hypothetical protein
MKPTTSHTARRIALAGICAWRVALITCPAPAQTEPSTQPGMIYVGEVLGRDVYAKGIPADRSRRIEELHRLLSRPLFERYHATNRDRLDPTDEEIVAFIELINNKGREDTARREGRREEIVTELAKKRLNTELRKSLEDELAQLNRIGDHPANSRELDAEASREFAQWWISRWKLNQALYHDYGGGRILWQQFGTEAWDATRRFYEAHEKDGSLKIPNPTLRAEFYEYWSREHAAFLSERAEELLSPPWQKRPATNPVKK